MHVVAEIKRSAFLSSSNSVNFLSDFQERYVKILVKILSTKNRSSFEN